MFQTRPATKADHEAAKAIHHSAYRAMVERVWGWDDDFQDRAFQTEYATERATVILIEGEVVGIFQVARKDGDVWILDMAI